MDVERQAVGVLAHHGDRLRHRMRIVPDLHVVVVVFRADRQSHVRGERPGGGGPHDQLAAAAVFERMLWLNPSDNQGVRFLIGEVRAGRPWRRDGDHR